jgi:hypothetical protein
MDLSQESVLIEGLISDTLSHYSDAEDFEPSTIHRADVSVSVSVSATSPVWSETNFPNDTSSQIVTSYEHQSTTTGTTSESLSNERQNDDSDGNESDISSISKSVSKKRNFDNIENQTIDSASSSTASSSTKRAKSLIDKRLINLIRKNACQHLDTTRIPEKEKNKLEMAIRSFEGNDDLDSIEKIHQTLHADCQRNVECLRILSTKYKSVKSENKRLKLETARKMGDLVALISGPYTRDEMIRKINVIVDINKEEPRISYTPPTPEPQQTDQDDCILLL